MKYLKQISYFLNIKKENTETLTESIYNDDRKDAKYKVGDYVKIINKHKNFSDYPIKVLHISSEYNSPEMPVYDCLVMYDTDSDYIGTIIDEYEKDIRFATKEEINDLEYKIDSDKYNL